MRSYRFRYLFGIRWQTADKKTLLYALFVPGFSDFLNHGDRFKSGPLFFLLQLVNLAADDAPRCFYSTMPGIHFLITILFALEFSAVLPLDSPSSCTLKYTPVARRRVLGRKFKCEEYIRIEHVKQKCSI